MDNNIFNEKTPINSEIDDETSKNSTLNNYYKGKSQQTIKPYKSKPYIYDSFGYDIDFTGTSNNSSQFENNLIDNAIPFNNETDLKKRPSLNLNSLNNFPLQIDTNSSNNQKTINNNNINIYGLSYENPFLRNRNSAKPPINISSGNTINNINNSRTSLSQRTQTPSYFSIKKKNKNKLKTFAGDPTDKTLLENHGMRVRYEDYTTIDWIHDNVRDKARVRKIVNRLGIKGQIYKFWDKSIGWILVVTIGIICGVVAAGIETSSKWIFDRKLGYCQRSFSLNRELCCMESKDYICDEWITWASFFKIEDEDKSYIINWIFYGLIASFLGLISVLITSLSIKSSKENHIEKIEEHYRETNIKIDSESQTKYNSIQLESRNLYNNKGKKPVSDSSQPSSKHFSNQHERHYLQEDKPEKIYCYAAGSGIPEVKTILSGFVIRGFLGLKTLIVKVFGLIFAISASLVIGTQGPLVHICCCIGNIVSRCFKKYKHNEAKKREILSAACSSGVAVAFGAPIGGVLFSFEEVSYYFPQKTMWRSFIAAMVAAVTLKYSNPYRTGKAVLFEVEYNKPWHYFELLFFVLIGILGGLFGSMFIKINLKWRKFRKKLKINTKPIIEVVVISLISGLLGYINSYSRIGNTELIGDLFKECNDKNRSKHNICEHNELFNQVVKDLLITLLIKVFLTTITLCIRVPCGYFVPTLVSGALFGRIVGICLLRLIKLYPEFSLFSFCPANGECITPGVYAMLGAAAALCGVTRMTISLVVIMFELTGGVSYVIPIMITILAAKWTADAFDKNSIFDCLIEENDYPYLNNKKTPIHTKSIVDIMDSDVLTLEVNHKYSVDDIIDILNYKLLTTQYSDDSGFPILDNGILVGYIAFNELEHAIYLVQKLSWDNKPCCFKRIVQSPNTEIDLTKKMNKSEKKSIRHIFTPISNSIFNSLQHKNFIPKDEEEEEANEEKIALLSEYIKKDELNIVKSPETTTTSNTAVIASTSNNNNNNNNNNSDNNNNNNKNNKNYNSITLDHNIISGHSIDIDMPQSYYQQQLQHSYMARNFYHPNGDDCNDTTIFSTSYNPQNQLQRYQLQQPTSAKSATISQLKSLPLATPTPHSEISRPPSIFENLMKVYSPEDKERDKENENENENENDKDIEDKDNLSNNPAFSSLTFPSSMFERINYETKNLLDEPLIYPFPDSYYALLLAASNSTNEEEIVKDGNLVQPEMNDFTPWVDQAPLMISVNSSMELATEMFVRLGTRYLCVVLDGHFVGVIHKKALIKYIKSLK
jgi:chloride channel 3/4/5